MCIAPFADPTTRRSTRAAAHAVIAASPTKALIGVAVSKSQRMTAQSQDPDTTCPSGSTASAFTRAMSPVSCPGRRSDIMIHAVKVALGSILVGIAVLGLKFVAYWL